MSAIRAYQRHLSPHKGFSCAYREHTGRASCSALGYRVVRRHGVFAGLGLLRERLHRCGEIHRDCLAARPRRSERGDCDCDLPCDACDCADCNLPGRKRGHPRRRRGAPRPG